MKDLKNVDKQTYVFLLAYISEFCKHQVHAARVSEMQVITTWRKPLTIN